MNCPKTALKKAIQTAHFETHFDTQFWQLLHRRIQTDIKLTHTDEEAKKRFFLTLLFASSHSKKIGASSTSQNVSYRLHGTFIENLFFYNQNSYPMNILKRKNRTGDKIMFYYDFGRELVNVLQLAFSFTQSRKTKFKEITTKRHLHYLRQKRAR